MVATLKDVDQPRDVDTTSALALIISYRKNNWIIIRKGASTKMDLGEQSNNHPTGECGRTAQNTTLTEALVFHQTLSTPKASYSGGIRRAHH